MIRHRIDRNLRGTCVKTKMHLMAAAVSLAAFAAIGIAAAADYPTRPITVIVPYGAGGGTDTAARLVAEEASREIGQRFVIDNRSGGGTIIGTQQIARAAPDGYTLGIVDPAFAINPSLYMSLPFDTKKDFAAVSLLTTSPLVLVVPAQVPAKTLAEFVAYVKQTKGGLNFGSPGIGSAGHLGAEQFRRAAGLDIMHIPYRGGAPAMQDLLTNRVSMMMLSTNSVIAHIQAGTLRALALTGDKQDKLLPDVPTFAQAGYPAVTTQTFAALIAPAGTPKEILDVLQRAFSKAAHAPEIQPRMDELGLVPVGGTSAGLATYFDKIMGEFKQVIDESHIERLK
jgi:tripartite-type tricarboxylate transporter receptor subunit TctC